MTEPTYGSDDQLFTVDLGVERQRMQEVVDYVATLGAYERRFSVDDAVNVANFGRFYMGVSPEMAAGVAEAGIAWDLPMLQDLVTKDAVQQDSVVSNIFKGLRSGTRGAIMGVDSVWDEGLPRLTRTVINGYQDNGDNLYQSWQRSGSSYLGQAARDVSQGREVRAGSGWTPQPTPIHEYEGFDTEFNQNLAQQAEGGQVGLQGMRDAYDMTHEGFVQDYGYSTIQRTWESQEATIVSKTRGDKTYATPFSFGRAPAVQVFTPGTVPFRLLSAAIDAPIRVGADPLNVPLSSLAKAYKARNLFQPLASGDVGIVNSWRPFTKPIPVSEWLRDGSTGGKLIRYLRDSKIGKVNELIGDLPNSAQRKIALLDDEADIIEALAPHMGVEVPKKPKAPFAFEKPILGSTVYGDNVAANMISRVGESAVGKTYKMLRDSTDAIQLDPTDPSKSMYDVNRRLQAWGINDDAIDDVLMSISKAEGDLGRMGEAYEKIVTLFEDRLLTKKVFGMGYEPREVTHIMRTWIKEQQQAQIYFDDLVGNNHVPPGSKVWEFTTPNGTDINIPLDSAHLDSEFGHRSIYMPSGKDTRRALSGFRIFNDQIREAASILPFIDGIPTGLGATRGQMVLDSFVTGWRNLALLRVGWLLRYLPDEAARYAASGQATTPGAYLNFFMRSPDGMLGNNLNEALKMQGLGATGFIHRFDDTAAGQQFAASRVSWAVAKYGTGPFKRGIAREALQLHKSKLVQSLLRNGDIDGAVAYYKTAAGKIELREISRNAAPGGRLAKMADDEFMLRDVLAEAESRVAKLTGGRYLYKGQNGKWLTDMGNEVELYESFTGELLRQELVKRNIPGRSKLKTTDEMRIALIKDDGFEALLTVGEQRNFVVVKDGSSRARQFLNDGMSDDGKLLIGENMDELDLIDLEEAFPGYVEAHGFDLPPQIKTPNLEEAARLEKHGNSFVDSMFKLLGQVPTETIIRSPYAKTVYTDEMAQMYIFGNQRTRAKIQKWADSQGLGPALNKMVEQQWKSRGMKSLPMGTADISKDNMDRIARTVASQKTKHLFYDLAKGHNWAEMSRIVFPFGDAWWEVLSKWAGLLNPLPIATKNSANYARRIQNLRRGQQGIMSVQRDGWFEEDAFGNEVFAWSPAAGVLSTLGGFDMGDGGTIDVKLQPSSMLFVDPSDPGTVWRPGFHPVVNIAAALVSPLLPPSAQASFDDFFFGEFKAPAASPEGVFDALAPTWMRRIKDNWFDEADRKEKGNINVSIFEVLTASGDDRFAINNKDDVTRVMKHANDIAGEIHIARTLDGFLGPSAQYEAEFWVSMEDNPQAGFWMSERGLGADIQAFIDLWEPLIGKEEAEAQSYVYALERYGINIDKFNPSTQYVRDFPSGVDGYVYLQQHPELLEFFPITMMMFIPEEDDVEFYRPAWDAAKDAGARVRVTPEMAPAMTSSAMGNRQYESLVENRDAAIRQAEGRYADGSYALADSKRKIQDDFERQTYQLGAENGPYWAWGYDAREGDVSKPSYQDALDEIARSAGFRLEVTRDGEASLIAYDSDAEQYAKEMNPELHGFIKFSMSKWAEAQEVSIARLNTSSWWASSDTETDPLPQLIRDWFISELEEYVDSNMDSHKSKLGAQYITENVFTGLLQGADFNDPFIIYREPPAFDPEERPDILNPITGEEESVSAYEQAG